MPINYQGQITKKEYKKAIEIHYSHLKWLKWMLGFLLCIILLSSIVTISRDPSRLQYFFPSIIIPLVFLTYPWWFIYIQSASYNQKRNVYRTPIYGSIDDTGISINGQTVKISFLWNAFTHYKISNEMVLLYQGKTCFNIFTAGLFGNEDDWKKFLDELKIRIVKK